MNISSRLVELTRKLASQLIIVQPVFLQNKKIIYKDKKEEENLPLECRGLNMIKGEQTFSVDYQIMCKITGSRTRDEIEILFNNYSIS